MKLNNQFIAITIIAGVLLPFLLSCSNDDEALNEWNTSYVSISPLDYLRPLPTFSLKHSTEEGVTGLVEFQFHGVMQKSVDEDIIVNFDATCEGISTENIHLTEKNIVIKAGATTSAPITLSITDWKELEASKSASEHQVVIKITGIGEPTPRGVATGAYHQEIKLNITKAEERQPEEVLLTEKSAWIFTFMEGVENAGANSVAGTGGSDVATNGVPFWITVDLTEVKTVTGIHTRHWGAFYAPSKVAVFSSEDGREWLPVIEAETSGNKQDIKFKSPVKTRFLKYQMIDVPGRVDITSLFVYAWE